jgi:hypothetical protein
MAATATPVSQSFTKLVFSAFNEQNLSIYQRFGQLFPRLGVNTLYSSAGNMHLFGAILLRKTFQVN